MCMWVEMCGEIVMYYENVGLDGRVQKKLFSFLCFSKPILGNQCTVRPDPPPAPELRRWL